MKKPKVIWLLTHRIQYFMNLLEALAARGRIDPIAIFAHESEQLHDKDFGRAVNWDSGGSRSFEMHVLKDTRKRGNTGFFASRSTQLVPLLERLDPDIVHLNGWRNCMSIQAWLWARRWGRPYFVRGDGDLLGKKNRTKTHLRNLASRPFLSKAAKVMYQGRSNKDYMLAGGARPEALEWIPCVSDSRIFRVPQFNSAEDRFRFRRAHGASGEQVVFVVSGKLIDRKRPEDVIRALTYLREDAGVKIWFLGSGVLEQPMKDLSKRLGVGEFITWLGFQEQKEVPKVLQAADCFLHPSEMDPWPYAIIDAAVSRLALILSDRVGSTPDWRAEPQAALAYTCGDPVALSRAIQRLLDEPLLRKHLASNAHKHVERHTEEVFCGIFEDCVHEVLRPCCD